MNSQAGILADVPKRARYLMFSYEGATNEANETLDVLVDLVDGDNIVAGVGISLVEAMGKKLPDLGAFPAMAGAGFDIPSTQSALWLWLRGNDRGELLHRSITIENVLDSNFQLINVLDGFMHRDSRDLTGYEDGTENPEGDDAVAAALVHGKGAGLDGSSFVAVQQWLHNFAIFNNMSGAEQDDAIGRRKSDNVEFEGSPESAHVKRTAQESFSPEAFILRRSMPWVEGTESGLNFVAFGHSFTAFEAQLNRMVGNEDGISDAIFKFTRPISGAYFWCPPMKNGKLDVTALR